MDSARQLLRWSIPGFFFVLMVVIMHSVWVALVEHRNPLQVVGSANASGILAVVASGIPLGFFIYQLYYWRFQGVGGRPAFPFYRNDRGGRIVRLYLYRYGGRLDFLESVDVSVPVTGSVPVPEHINDPLMERLSNVWQLKRPWHSFQHLRVHICGRVTATSRWCRPCQDKWSRYFALNWTLFQGMLDLSSTKPTGSWIKTEYTVGSDLYHALGAARAAALLGGFSVALYDLVILPIADPTRGSFGTLWALLIVAAIWLILEVAQYALLTKSRANITKDYEQRIAAGLAFLSKL